MEFKCFVAGCNNRPYFKWEVSNSLTYSCKIHKILENDTLIQFQVIGSNYESYVPKIKISKSLIFLLYLLVGTFIFWLYHNSAQQNKLLSEIKEELSEIKKTEDVNYKFYSELFTIKDMLENIGKGDFSLEKKEHHNKLDKAVEFAERGLKLFIEKDFLPLENDLYHSFKSLSGIAEKLEFISEKFGLNFDLGDSYILSLSFLSSSSELLVGTLSGNVNYLNIPRVEYKTIVRSDLKPYSMATNSDYSAVLITGNSLIRLYRLTSFTHIGNLPGHKDLVLCAAFSKDNDFIVTGSSDKTLAIWYSETFQLKEMLIGHTGNINTVAVSPNGEFIASGGEDSKLILWNFVTGRILNEYLHPSPVFSITISSDSAKIVTSTKNGEIFIWEKDPDQAPVMLRHKSHVKTVLLVKNDEILLSCAENSVRIWDVTKKEIVLELFHPKILLAMAVSKDLKWIVTGDETSRIWVWEMKTGALKWVFGGRVSEIEHIEISEDAKKVLVADAGIIRIWSSQSLKLESLFTRKEQLLELKEFNTAGLRQYLA